jgi:hypothetical protein
MEAPLSFLVPIRFLFDTLVKFFNAVVITFFFFLQKFLEIWGCFVFRLYDAKLLL